MSTKPLFENISDNVVVHALTNWICTGYYLESNFDLRQKIASMERIIDAATNVVNELKQKDSSELIIPYIDGHIRYKHICHTFTRDFLRIIVSKTQYTSFDYPKYGITSYDNSPEIITCPKAFFQQDLVHDPAAKKDFTGCLQFDFPAAGYVGKICRGRTDIDDQYRM